MLGIYSIWHWLIVLSVIILLFGGQRVSKTIREISSSIKDIASERRNNKKNHKK